MTDASNAHYIEAMGLFGQDKFAEAIAAYTKALDARPEWTDALHGLAMAHMKGGTVDEAITIGKRIVELDPKDPFAHTSLSMFYQRKSQIAEEAGDAEATKMWIEIAEKEGAAARLLSWKEELKTNPNALPPGPAGSMDVIQ